VITPLPGHEAAPAEQVRDTYLSRWSASETTFGEDKATITGAGDRTSGPASGTTVSVPCHPPRSRRRRHGKRSPPRQRPQPAPRSAP
jgi:hypothetical protein